MAGDGAGGFCPLWGQYSGSDRRETPVSGSVRLLQRCPHGPKQCRIHFLEHAWRERRCDLGLLSGFAVKSAGAPFFQGPDEPVPGGPDHGKSQRSVRFFRIFHELPVQGEDPQGADTASLGRLRTYAIYVGTGKQCDVAGRRHIASFYCAGSIQRGALAQIQPGAAGCAGGAHGFCKLVYRGAQLSVQRSLVSL